MADVVKLAVEPREKAGKGSARANRRAGLIPAVVYGDKKDPDMITIAKNDLFRVYHKGGFLTTRFELEINGKGKQQVLPRDIQMDPVTDQPLHVDFLRISKDTRVTVDVPVHVEGEKDSPGLRRGGVLNIVRHTVEVEAPATDIPDSFTVSVEGLDIGDSVHSTAIDLQEGVEFIISDRVFTLATIAAPSRVRTEEEREAEAAAAAAAEAEAEALAEEGEGEEGAGGEGGEDKGEGEGREE